MSIAGCCLLAIAALLCLYDSVIPDEVSFYRGEAIPSYLGADAVFMGGRACFTDGGHETVMEGEAEYRLLGCIPVKRTGVRAYDDCKLYVGGMPFGVKFYTDGVTVVGFCDVDTENGKVNPAYEAGLRQKDIITHINGKPVSGATELTEVVEASGGKELVFRVSRGGESFDITVIPILSRSEGIGKAGMWVRDSGAGIGTVSFILPESGCFVGLGHGICDAETGELLKIGRGNIVDVTISGITKGVSGTPGELRGFFNAGKRGTLLGNDECGVFGVFAELPSGLGEPISLGLRDELREGEATIYCTLDNGTRESYTVEISNINRNATGGKCFGVKVTDKRLLEKTGGIVQGMSGSPIIQNGKLMGAVTHVMIGDPTAGYGIFAENMLKLVS